MRAGVGAWVRACVCVVARRCVRGRACNYLPKKYCIKIKNNNNVIFISLGNYIQ